MKLYNELIIIDSHPWRDEDEAIRSAFCADFTEEGDVDMIAKEETTTHVVDLLETFQAQGYCLRQQEEEDDADMAGEVGDKKNIDFKPIDEKLLLKAEEQFKAAALLRTLLLIDGLHDFAAGGRGSNKDPPPKKTEITQMSNTLITQYLHDIKWLIKMLLCTSSNQPSQPHWDLYHPHWDLYHLLLTFIDCYLKDSGNEIHFMKEPEPVGTERPQRKRAKKIATGSTIKIYLNVSWSTHASLFKAPTGQKESIEFLQTAARLFITDDLMKVQKYNDYIFVIMYIITSLGTPTDSTRDDDFIPGLSSFRHGRGFGAPILQEYFRLVLKCLGLEQYIPISKVINGLLTKEMNEIINILCVKTNWVKIIKENPLSSFAVKKQKLLESGCSDHHLDRVSNILTEAKDLTLYDVDPDINKIELYVDAQSKTRSAGYLINTMKNKTLGDAYEFTFIKTLASIYDGAQAGNVETTIQSEITEIWVTALSRHHTVGLTEPQARAVVKKAVSLGSLNRETLIKADALIKEGRQAANSGPLLTSDLLNNIKSEDLQRALKIHMTVPEKDAEKEFEIRIGHSTIMRISYKSAPPSVWDAAAAAAAAAASPEQASVAAAAGDTTIVDPDKPVIKLIISEWFGQADPIPYAVPDSDAVVNGARDKFQKAMTTHSKYDVMYCRSDPDIIWEHFKPLVVKGCTDFGQILSYNEAISESSDSIDLEATKLILFHTIDQWCAGIASLFGPTVVCENWTDKLTPPARRTVTTVANAPKAGLFDEPIMESYFQYESLFNSGVFVSKTELGVINSNTPSFLGSPISAAQLMSITENIHAVPHLVKFLDEQAAAAAAASPEQAAAAAAASPEQAAAAALMDIRKPAKKYGLKNKKAASIAAFAAGLKKSNADADSSRRGKKRNSADRGGHGVWGAKTKKRHRKQRSNRRKPHYKRRCKSHKKRSKTQTQKTNKKRHSLKSKLRIKKRSLKTR
jgi:hypothetical protein